MEGGGTGYHHRLGGPCGFGRDANRDEDALASCNSPGAWRHMTSSRSAAKAREVMSEFRLGAKKTRRPGGRLGTFDRDNSQWNQEPKAANRVW